MPQKKGLMHFLPDIKADNSKEYDIFVIMAHRGQKI